MPGYVHKVVGVLLTLPNGMILAKTKCLMMIIIDTTEPIRTPFNNPKNSAPTMATIAFQKASVSVNPASGLWGSTRRWSAPSYASLLPTIGVAVMVCVWPVLVI
jgi:hypothetical protein